ncbi:polysaccharide deacetylase family protein, partial [Ideonella sp.]|uniref:polysaccharide deacetylase family protein n=1 Tax=Ideonella sp. TaxID=1929293 RepID=UPI003BB5D4A0
GVVSFSFDDAPHTACTTGRDVLEAHGCHGTWYVAGGLTDQPEQGRLCHSQADLEALLARGHHLGCHTFSHHPVDRLSRAEMLAELERNADFLQRLGLNAEALHFSFPLGAFDLKSKELASQRFITSRITGGGLQTGEVDLQALRSQALYSQSLSRAAVERLNRQTAERGGWLIYYSHDVEADPSRWGCTPERLDHAVRNALASGCQVLSVRDALAHWQQAAASDR